MNLKNELNEVPEKTNIQEKSKKEFEQNSLEKFDQLFERNSEIRRADEKKRGAVVNTLRDSINKFEDLFKGDNLENENTDVINETKEENSEGEKENPHQEIIDGKTYYYDDNGKLYRVEKELQPNTEYEINGYKYKTDEKGRIISAEGKLHVKERDGRLPIKDSLEDIGKGDEKEGDDRGHLIGDQFDGSNGMENMVPQDADINRNDFRKLENELAKVVKDGKEVYVKVEPVYEGDSRRPAAVVVTYSINGEEHVRVFPNNKEG